MPGGDLDNTLIVAGSDGTPIDGTGGRLKVQASSVDGERVTYSAGNISLALATLATDFFTITGSATKTVRINRIRCAFTGGGSNVKVQLLKRSTANTAGTSTVATNVAHDSNDAAATATVRSYTANPTLGTLVGLVRAESTNSPLASSATDNRPVDWVFGDSPGEKQPVLRGTSQLLALNLNGVTLTSGTVSVYVEWTEE